MSELRCHSGLEFETSDYVDKIANHVDFFNYYFFKLDPSNSRYLCAELLLLTDKSSFFSLTKALVDQVHGDFCLVDADLVAHVVECSLELATGHAFTHRWGEAINKSHERVRFLSFSYSQPTDGGAASLRLL